MVLISVIKSGSQNVQDILSIYFLYWYLEVKNNNVLSDSTFVLDC